MINQPPCEICHQHPAEAFVFIVGTGWKYACPCTRDDEQYWILIAQFENPHILGRAWRKHLREKTWFVEHNFDALLARFYSARSTL